MCDADEHDVVLWSQDGDEGTAEEDETVTALLQAAEKNDTDGVESILRDCSGLDVMARNQVQQDVTN